MKHALKINLLLITLFIATHLIGFAILNSYTTQTLPFNVQAPQIAQETSYIPLFLAILATTALAMILMYFNAIRLWRYWFVLSIWVCLTLAFAAFIHQVVAITLAAFFAYLKVYRSNPYVHNATELFMYGGLAALFVPLLTLKSIAILLLLIAIYDIIAVYKTRHMITLAKFQTKTKLFAGLHIPYGKQTTKKLPQLKKTQNQAVLGGGDIGFPLLFAGVVFLQTGLLAAIIITLCAALGLFILFYKAKKTKYYPAMPVVTLGCFIGYAIVLLL